MRMSRPRQRRSRSRIARLTLVYVAVLVVLGFAASEALGAPSAQRAPGAPARPGKPAACPAAWRVTWQRLADRIKAPVYCPAWLPDPLTGDIGGRWSNIDSVAKDGAYLMGFVWQETGPGAAGGELHVNLRGYPGRPAIPTCEDTLNDGGKIVRRKLPCFADARGLKRAGGITAMVYTVNQGADQWHVLYAWRQTGSLYTLSEHVAPPLSFAKVVAYLERELASLELVRPTG